MDYKGPLGCRGRYFTGEDLYGLDLNFRYSAHDAYLSTGPSLYHLIGGPVRRGRFLQWTQNVDGLTITAAVACPLPPASIPPISAAAPKDVHAGPFDACALLTPALATQTLGPGAGKPQRTDVRGVHASCNYRTASLRLVRLDLLDPATIESEPLWRSPAVSGLGVPAHAAPAPDGLVC